MAVRIVNEIAVASLENLQSADKDRQDTAFTSLMKATAQPVDWAYDVWEPLVKLLADKDNRRRAVAAQVLCNLAKSDPKHKMRKTLPLLLEVTKDERFVTARHCMQSLWKVGIVSKELQKQLLTGLGVRFDECVAEKNCTLIRYDIIVVLGQLFDQTRDEQIRQTAQVWIAKEPDLKYRKKYAGVWKAK
jgi:HEAT repeat protein